MTYYLMAHTFNTTVVQAVEYRPLSRLLSEEYLQNLYYKKNYTCRKFTTPKCFVKVFSFDFVILCIHKLRIFPSSFNAQNCQPKSLSPLWYCCTKKSLYQLQPEEAFLTCSSAYGKCYCNLIHPKELLENILLQLNEHNNI